MTNSVARMMPGTAKMMTGSHAPPARAPAGRPAAEEQHENQSGDHRRDGEGQVDERDQQVLARESRTWRRSRRRPRRTQVPSGTQTPAVRKVKRMARERVAVGTARRSRRRRPSRMPAKTPPPTARSRNNPKKASAVPISSQRTRAVRWSRRGRADACAAIVIGSVVTVDAMDQSVVFQFAPSLPARTYA